jgi:hypothetical protein
MKQKHTFQVPFRMPHKCDRTEKTERQSRQRAILEEKKAEWMRDPRWTGTLASTGLKGEELTEFNRHTHTRALNCWMWASSRISVYLLEVWDRHIYEELPEALYFDFTDRILVRFSISSSNILTPFLL